MTEGRCLRCQKNVEIQEGEEVIWKNGMKALKGKCPNCSAGVCRILGKAAPAEAAAPKAPASEEAAEETEEKPEEVAAE